MEKHWPEISIGHEFIQEEQLGIMEFLAIIKCVFKFT